MNQLIKAESLMKRYGTRTVVNGINLTVSSGEIVAIIGPNGAGKTTAIEMILGIRRPDGGKVEYWSDNPRAEIGVQLQSTPFFPGLRAGENLQLFAAFYGIKLKSQEIAKLLEKCGLSGMEKINAARMSGGQQKRLAIAIAMVHQPKILFLDEPTAALDPRARQEIREIIDQLAKQGTSVVFTSHDMEEVGKLADRVIMIEQGEIKASGTPSQLYERFEVNNLEELYLRLTK